MEFAKIENLLDVYFEGNTSLAQEKVLKEYFSTGDIAPHLEVYKPLFNSFEKAKEEVSEKEIILPTSRFQINPWWYSVAAMLIIAIGVAGFMFSKPSLTEEEQEAIIAFHKSKEVMFMLSESLNKGAEDLAYLTEFTETTNKILK